MTDLPILFSTPLVPPVLDGTKTQTRRVVKGWEKWPQDTHHVSILTTRGTALAVDANRHTYGPEIRCPYGMPGGRLWVRETFYAWGRWETRYSAKKGRDEWHFVDMTLECGQAYQYPATDTSPQPLRGRRDAGVTPGWWKRPAIHMPRVASRIALEITALRVERLNNISEADAIAEGCKHSLHLPGGRFARENYAHLWWTINGDDSWELNHWVWVIEFRVLKGGAS